MKGFYRLVWALIAIGFVGTIVFIILAPDTIPVHYNAAWEVTRIGSKYEYIMFPFISAGMGAIFLLLAKQAQNKNTLIEVIFLVTAIGEVLLFSGMGGYIMWMALSYA